MSEQGYTLVETLTALAMMGMAMSGMAVGLHVLSRQQFAITDGLARETRLRSAGLRIERMLAVKAPYRAQESDRLVGDAQGFRFDCGQPEPCTVRASGEGLLQAEGGNLGSLKTAVPGVGTLSFSYQGRDGTTVAWPPADQRRQPLRSISLIQAGPDGQTVVFVARLAAEQPAECQFDPVMQDCR